MSSEEEKAIIGGLVVEHGEVKRRIVALESELGKIGSIFEHLGRAFMQPARMVQQRDEFEKNLSALPERQHVIDLIEELQTAKRRKDELTKSIKECGIDI
jgi:hypothetical protein